MTELYLILHKVRGEPTFDVAVRLDDESWIIPTSGHRAYPYWSCPLLHTIVTGPKGDSGCFGIMTMALKIPEDWPDHYAVNNRARPEAVSASDLEDLLG